MHSGSELTAPQRGDYRICNSRVACTHVLNHAYIPMCRVFNVPLWVRIDCGGAGDVGQQQRGTARQRDLAPPVLVALAGGRARLGLEEALDVTSEYTISHMRHDTDCWWRERRYLYRHLTHILRTSQFSNVNRRNHRIHRHFPPM